SHLLQHLSKPAYWHEIERDLNELSIEVYDGCAQRSLVALTSPLELVSGLTAIAKTRPTSYWLAPPATLTSDCRCLGSSRDRASFVAPGAHREGGVGPG